MTDLYHFKDCSKNAKLGPIPATTSTSVTCPPSCGLFDVCYAKTGHQGMHWNKVNKGERGDDWHTFLAKLRTIAKGAIWRHNVSGDLPGVGEEIDPVAMRELVKANKGRRGFTYTHKPMDNPVNRQAVADANADGFTVNLSGDNLSHADQLADTEAGPVTAVIPADTERKRKGKVFVEPLDEYRERLAAMDLHTPAGRRVVVCPATYRDEVNCSNCQLCQRMRSTVVGFPAHGTKKSGADAVARSAA